MPYVDGFVVPVPTKNVATYRKISEACGKIWMEHGALEYREALADDVKPGKVTSFPQSVIMKKSETVFFSWIVYRNRAHRDAVNTKVMADPRMAAMGGPANAPFDGQRMIFGGFEVVVDAKAARKSAAGKRPVKKATKKQSAKKRIARGR